MRSSWSSIAFCDAMALVRRQSWWIQPERSCSTIFILRDKGIWENFRKVGTKVKVFWDKSFEFYTFFHRSCTDRSIFSMQLWNVGWRNLWFLSCDYLWHEGVACTVAVLMDTQFVLTCQYENRPTWFYLNGKLLETWEVEVWTIWQQVQHTGGKRQALGWILWPEAALLHG